jgi:hypothetical protein
VIRKKKLKPPVEHESLVAAWWLQSVFFVFSFIPKRSKKSNGDPRWLYQTILPYYTYVYIYI